VAYEGVTMDNIYYTYLIGWSEHNKFYYGVRYSKHADINELWKKYKTSSKYVKAFTEEHGDPDIIQVRKVFDVKEKAIGWESKVLRRMKVTESDNFLNRWDNNTVPLNLEGPFPFESAYIQTKVDVTLSKKYGGRGSSSPHIAEKVKKTNNVRYGSDHTLNCKPVAEARLQVIRAKYGADNPFANNETLQKVMVERYGVSNMMHDPTVKEKHKQSMSKVDWNKRNKKTKKTILERYGTTDMLNRPEVREFNKRGCPHGCKDGHLYDAGNFTNHMVKVHGWNKEQIKGYKNENKKD
jgi:hypothetical protein